MGGLARLVGANRENKRKRSQRAALWFWKQVQIAAMAQSWCEYIKNCW